jgi:hypothetical protein
VGWLRVSYLCPRCGAIRRGPNVSPCERPPARPNQFGPRGVALVWWQGAPARSPNAASATAPQPTIPDPLPLTGEDKAFVDEAIADWVEEGVLTKRMERQGHTATVWVGPKFRGLPFEKKDDVLTVVYKASFGKREDERDEVIIRDGATGRELGRFGTRTNGLKLH